MSNPRLRRHVTTTLRLVPPQLSLRARFAVAGALYLAALVAAFFVALDYVRGLFRRDDAGHA